MVILVLAALLSLIAPWIVHTFLDKSYTETIPFIPWIAFSFAFSGMYFMVVNYIFYMKKTAVLAYVTFAVGLMHVGLSYLLIQHNGAIGAAQATSISTFIGFILVWILSDKVYKMPWLLKN